MKFPVFISTIVLLSVASLSSCTKSKTTPSSPTPPATGSSSTPSPIVGNVDGALISLKIDLATVVAGYPVTVTTDNAIAVFFAARGNNNTYVDGGAISLNTYTLDKQSNKSYIKSATTGQTPDNLGIDAGTSSWSIGGNGSVPAFTYNNNAPFPGFTGAMPTSVTRSTALVILLGSNISNADSVIIFITTNDHKSLTRTFGGTVASATISAADLATLPAVNDNTAIIEVIPYRITLSTQGSKSYAFVKENAVVSNINIQ